jgi:chorismate mutase
MQRKGKTMMLVRGVRGATTVESNNTEQILDATKELLRHMIDANGIEEEFVASVMFTTTPDLNTAYPAKGARLVGWKRTALMGFQEMDMSTGLTQCIRILIHWNTTKTLDEINHIYLHGAEILRPDLKNKSSLPLSGTKG